VPEPSRTIYDHAGGTSVSWYRSRELSAEAREEFRVSSLRARTAKLKALSDVAAPVQEQFEPRLKINELMPGISSHGLPALSLFSGGGGLDLGFERGGFGHVASHDTLEIAGETLRANRPDWTVFSGADGDVKKFNWKPYRGELAVIHGGPPCQPFSTAGRQRGSEDERNMLPEFVRAVNEAKPLAFVAENVAALAGPKFAQYLQQAFIGPLARQYHVTMFVLNAQDFGVPQVRRRVFFVGFRRVTDHRRFEIPQPTHRSDHLKRGTLGPLSLTGARPTMGVREALGLPPTGVDGLAPTIRSTLTGPRHTTSILNSASGQRVWAELGIWPNGVARSRAAAARFPTRTGDRRLAVADCALLQGFPSSWAFPGPVYKALGQIGNSVAPPVGYHVAVAVAQALGVRD